MRDTKLEQIFRSLNAKEKRAFSDFAASPFFNKRNDAVQLCHWLAAGEPLEPTEKVFAHLFPGAKYDKQRLLLAMSHLQRLAEQFVTYRHWREKPAAYETELVQALRHRGLEIHFAEALRTARVTLNRHSLRNSDYYIRCGQVLWEEARFDQSKNRTAVKHLGEMSDNADLAWLIQKLRYLCLHRTQQMLYKADDSLNWTPEMETILNRHHLHDAPAVAIWYNCLKMLDNPASQEHFARFKSLLLEQDQLFDAEEIKDLHLFALNFCIRKVNEGQVAFFHDIMDFYKDGLTKGYLMENGILSRFTYHNIVAAALQTREFEWVEDFIGRYKNALERSYRDSSYNFNRARLAFKRGRYDEALALLQHSNYYDPLLSLAARTMSLKIYYELHEYDLLASHLEAFKNYIRRKSILGYHRTNYLNLVKYTQLLISVNPFDKAEVEALRDKIRDEQVLTEREWLLEQAAELRKSH